VTALSVGRAVQAALNGIYVIRTGLPKKQMSAPDVVRSYGARPEIQTYFAHATKTQSSRHLVVKVAP
jgi:hypothetical protein